ncbi:MAG TPA: sulfotransferase domain-containing protein [Candidatus Binataceae bacterium]|nr:sulfotransferase domain-containing protein [Candidatus Binataceae bacterium]
MPERGPKPTRRYFTHFIDSSRWSSIALRPRDIIVSTSPKSGTTWMQRIVSVLIHGEHLPGSLSEISPWIDLRAVPVPIEALAARLANQTYRRSMKAHLPFDALPYDREVKYICVGRDGRDVALSAHNHFVGLTDQAIEMANSPPGLFPDRYERVPADIHAFIKGWLTRGNPHLAGETDGYPAMSHFAQIRSFWDFRDLPNVFMSHYQDLMTDFANEARRLAKFLDIDANGELIGLAERLCSFEAMKRDGAALMPSAVSILDGGVQRFFNKGVSGRWREVFTADELALYDAAVRRNLTPECARWLEHGRRALKPQ